MLLNDHFETLLVWPIESGQQQVQVHCESIEDGDIVLLGAHQAGHWLLRGQIRQGGRHVAVEVTVHTSLRPTIQNFLHILVEALGLEAE